MNTAIDASALLALLFAEPGAEIVADAIAAGAATSAVNLSEVATVLIRHKRDPEDILRPVHVQLAVEAFTYEDAIAAAALQSKTFRKGLSLGDRSCLALAQRLAVPALTAERVWAELEIDVDVQLIRPHSS